jgi:glutamate 5-kinase
MEYMNNSKKIIVLKYGSATIEDQSIEQYAKQIKNLSADWSPVIVSSGSVKLGKSLVQGEFSSRLLASIGSGQLIAMWQKHLSANGMIGSQILVTHSDIGNNDYFASTLLEMLDNDVIPIINENDTLSNTELMKLRTGGDNDGLAACIASELNAESLILLSSDVEGYMSDSEAQKCVDISCVDRKDYFKKSIHGTGGIDSKIKAAQKAFAGGVSRVYFANAKQDYQDILNRSVGSCFCGICD